MYYFVYCVRCVRITGVPCWFLVVPFKFSFYLFCLFDICIIRILWLNNNKSVLLLCCVDALLERWLSYYKMSIRWQHWACNYRYSKWCLSGGIHNFLLQKSFMSKFMESGLSTVRISDSNLISETAAMVFYCRLMLRACQPSWLTLEAAIFRL